MLVSVVGTPPSHVTDPPSIVFPSHLGLQTEICCLNVLVSGTMCMQLCFCAFLDFTDIGKCYSATEKDRACMVASDSSACL